MSSQIYIFSSIVNPLIARKINNFGPKLSEGKGLQLKGVWIAVLLGTLLLWGQDNQKSFHDETARL